MFLLSLLLACQGDRLPIGDDTSVDVGDDTAVDSGDPVDTGDSDTGSDTGVPDGAPTGPDSVRLPYVEVGDPAPSVVVTFGFPDGAADPSFSTTGPFTWSGDDEAVPAGGSRAITVTLTGGTGAIRLVDGTVSATSDGIAHTVDLSAVVARAGLPAATWATDGGVRTTTVALPTAPYPDGASTWTDPSVLIVVPDGLRGRPGVVTHLHGHNAKLSTTVPAQYLVRQFDLAGRNAVLVIPQGPVNAASGDFGKLMDPDGHAKLVDDALSVAWRDGRLDSPVPDLQVVTSHSGGYVATAEIITEGGYPIDAIHLFDSVYALESDFAAFGETGLLRSCYTATGGTADNNAVLADLLTDAGVDVADDFDDATLHGADVVIGPSASSHNGSIWEGRAYARWLVESGLSPHALAPPELLAATATGGTADVVWRVDRGSAGRRVRIEGSTDGSTWTSLGEGTSGALAVPTRPYLRAVAVSDVVSRPSDVYGATGADWLVVDGFDRVIGGSWTAATHPFAARVGNALGSFSTASNEAVAQGVVDLGDYDGVVWLLGDESTGDVTFDPAERAAIEAYVAGGGSLVVSGSEVGYASGTWLQTALHASYVADDAATTTAGGFSFGVSYPEDWPDVLSGSSTLWTYATGGAAAVVWDQRVAVVGFPLETLADDDLDPALAALITAVHGP